MWLLLIQTLISPVFDLWIFYQISKQKVIVKDIVILILCLLLSLGDSSGYISEFIADFFEIIVIIFYFRIIRKNKNIKLILGSTLIFGLCDLINSMIATIVGAKFLVKSDEVYILFFIIEFIIFLLILKYKEVIYRLLTDQNSLVFVELILYIYISTIIVYYFAVQINHMEMVFEVSLSLLILQILFAVLAYSATMKIQKRLLTKKEQQEQKLQLKLLTADRKAKEAKNQELILKQKQLKAQNAQLQEYTNYLDKNEDELRRFKHDYQNILNGLKMSAEEGDTKAVINQLDKYTNTQFDQKALRKYKGVNHIHEKNLKSIAIAKLEKLYSLNINYSFGCDKNIYHIPKEMDILDLIRIIGIAFDNAIEESQALIKESSDQESAQVDAMYYQENGNFEFEIRNRIRKESINANEISQKNYTTKQHHMGLGLANVKNIAHKYSDNLFINYDVKDDWFDFDLVLLPDDESEESEQ